MSAGLQKILLTVGAILSGGANVIPGLNPLIGLGLSCVSGFLIGWAHMKQPEKP